MKLKEALTEIQKVKKGNSALIPLGSSIFLEGDINETNKVIMGVGAGVCVRKDTKEAVEMVEKQIKEMNNIEEQLGKQMVVMMNYAKNLQKELSEMVKE